MSSPGYRWVLHIIAILVVYIVLGILYESCIHPNIILSGLPCAGFGALLTLEIFHMDLSIYMSAIQDRVRRLRRRKPITHQEVAVG